MAGDIRFGHMTEVSHGTVQFTAYEELRKVIVDIKHRGSKRHRQNPDDLLVKSLLPGVTMDGANNGEPQNQKRDELTESLNDLFSSNSTMIKSDFR
ncbi:hypothetical protein Ahy_A10g050320 [Arachis hypogaea]|uniref:Uncharacterized protein n=1 Tax=Arachis hypogaea TaxID=3818 RepID=A0A445B950_ARAHY|nr:hypothetical protein Ahy_A10g050320 [Arachis hypogaea]